MAGERAMSRVGQVWKQRQTDEDGGGELLWLVLSGPTSPPKGWRKLTHKVLVLETTGDNWVDQLKEGCEAEMDEHREGWWEHLEGGGRMKRLA